MISEINPWFPILYKILEYALACFPERFSWLSNWASSSKNSKAFSISTAAHQFRCKPAFFVCNLNSFTNIMCVIFLSWIISRSLTSQIITINTKSDNVIVEDWSIARFICFFYERRVEQKRDSWVFLPTSWGVWLIVAGRGSRVQSRGRGSKVAVAGPMSRSRAQSRGRGSNVATGENDLEFEVTEWKRVIWKKYKGKKIVFMHDTLRLRMLE